MAISGALIQKLLPILINHLRDENECKTYLVWVLGTKETISNRVAWHTSKNIFITDMVMQLDAFGITDLGESALGLFLSEIRKNVGVDIQTQIDELLEEISEEFKNLHANHRKYKNPYIQENNLQIEVAAVDSQFPYSIRKIRYRRIVEQAVRRSQVTSAGDSRLDATRVRLGVLPKDIEAIEAEVLEPNRDYSRKLQQYVQILSEIMQQEYPLSTQTRHELRPLQEVLEIQEEDIVKTEKQLFLQKDTISIRLVTITGDHSARFEVPYHIRVEEIILEITVYWNLPSNVLFGLHLRRNHEILEPSLTLQDVGIKSGDTLVIFPLIIVSV